MIVGKTDGKPFWLVSDAIHTRYLHVFQYFSVRVWNARRVDRWPYYCYYIIVTLSLQRNTRTPETHETSLFFSVFSRRSRVKTCRRRNGRTIQRDRPYIKCYNNNDICVLLAPRKKEYRTVRLWINCRLARTLDAFTIFTDICCCFQYFFQSFFFFYVKCFARCNILFKPQIICKYICI